MGEVITSLGFVGLGIIMILWGLGILEVLFKK